MLTLEPGTQNQFSSLLTYCPRKPEGKRLRASGLHNYGCRVFIIICIVRLLNIFLSRFYLIGEDPSNLKGLTALEVCGRGFKKIILFR